MTKLRTILLLAVVLAWTSLAFAQSSGNFSATILNAACTLDTGSGNLSGGDTCTLTNGAACASLPAPIKVSNAQGLYLLVTPSMVDGLFTSTTINTTTSTASADVGIQVCLNVTNPDGSPAAGAVVYPDECVTYDQRFQEISSSLFSVLSECNLVPDPAATGINCPGTACPAGDTCVVVGATGTCEIPGLNNSCDLTLILSTLSAHSFNFIVSVPGGSYNINATWQVVGVVPTGGKNNNAQVEACVGPGTLTVTQVKVFNKSGAITEQ
ncbi:MAG TPA: hypothetical protein VKU44_02690 [Terriglobia bacterium]|nr:hypothetical protein [Terriglobia bacterium]